METFTLQDRVKLTTAEVEARVDAFGSDVRSGLTAQPKSLPSRHFYDRHGSMLFEEICDLPEYYLTRTEMEILRHRADELVALLPGGVSLLELGSGSGVKTRILIEALLREEDRLRYVPMDISRSAIVESARDLVDCYDGLEIEAIVGEYQEGLRRIGKDGNGNRLILWLGSSIGNLDRREAVSFLHRVGAIMGTGDHALVGIDLRKARVILERAYDDPKGVTARFNRNILARINRELEGHFAPEKFRHRAFYDEKAGRIEMHLVSEESQTVRIDRLRLEVPFRAGETIHTENSYKYSVEEIESLVRAAGMRLAGQWFDRNRRFSLNLLAVD